MATRLLRAVLRALHLLCHLLVTINHVALYDSGYKGHVSLCVGRVFGTQYFTNASIQNLIIYNVEYLYLNTITFIT